MREENRQYSRSKIAIAAELRLDSCSDPIQVAVKNLSLHGILVQSDRPLQIGEQCTITILLGDVQDQLPISARGAVVRADEQDYGIQFDCIGFEDTEELERTILAKSDEPDRCLKEITKTSLIFDPLSAFDMDPTDPH